MGLLDKVKSGVEQAKNATTQFVKDKQLDEKLGNVTGSVKKAFSDASSSMKAYNEEAKELKKPLEGAIIRYEVTYKGGLEDIPKIKSGAWGMNVMPDMFSFRVTTTTKDWLYDLDIPYDSISDISIEKRTISNAEVLLGGGNDPNQQQENVVVLWYTDKNGVKATLRVEMLTGVTIFNQAAKCKELMDILRRNDILDRIKGKNETGAASGGVDIVSQIEKLFKLKEAGILTEEEFAAKKAELLGKM